MSRWKQIGSNGYAKRREAVADARIDRHSAVVHQDLPDIYGFIAERDSAAVERVFDAVEETTRMDLSLDRSATGEK